MLEYLRIAHLALIEDVEMEFSPGLNVLTGETGAGKSFILKALNFLTGEKMASDLVRTGEEKATAEALFVLPGVDGQEEEFAIRRELSVETGRSRVFVNGSLSSQDVIRNLRPKLIIHAGQHGQQRLLQPSYQGKVLDGFLADPSLPALRDDLVSELRELSRTKEEVLARKDALEDKREFLEFQKGEIDKIAPKPDEEEALEEKRRALRDQDAVKESIDRALSCLYGQSGEGEGILDSLSQLERSLDGVSRVIGDYTPFKGDISSMRDVLNDLAFKLREQKVFDSPDEDLESIEARLFALAQLKRKLKRDLPGILGLASEIQENLSFLDSLGLDLAEMEKREAALAARLKGILERLNSQRREAADTLCSSLEKELRDLGFSEHVRVLCDFTGHELHPGLMEDRARFLWLPNPGQAAQPLDHIASGGELSRFLLALTGLSAGKGDPTLIFDEVDAGVGGVTLNRVGDKLVHLAGTRQVILISHWPQLAALADRHFHIRKDVVDGLTYTRCQRLSGDDIFDELSRMAGDGEQGRAMAAKLLGTSP